MLSVEGRDAIGACGGLLARAVEQGVRVILCACACGEGEEAAARMAECRAAALVLGVEEFHGWTAEPSCLPSDHELVGRLGELCGGPAAVLAPAPAPRGGEADLPRRAVAAAALALGAPLYWYGVGEPLGGEGGALRKAEALGRLGCSRGTAVERLERVTPERARADLAAACGLSPGRATAVLSTWNKCEDVLANLEGLAAQTYPFARIVVVDNASRDETAVRVRARFPEVELIVMPHSAYGACETFNIGFASAGTELIAILDDDIVLPPSWLERAVRRLDQEPPTTAIVSTKIIEPGMPQAYAESEAINTERYMSTFRGCASLARAAAIAECGYYDERLYIYGNERDLTCRLLNRGYRVLQYPKVHAFHKTPFGIQMGKRSLYYHARNAWLVQLKYAPLGALLRMPLLVVSRVLLRRREREQRGEVADATGTIGVGSSIRSTPGAFWVLLRAIGSIIWNLPYCLRHREPCRAPDYELPIE